MRDRPKFLRPVEQGLEVLTLESEEHRVADMEYYSARFINIGQVVNASDLELREITLVDVELSDSSPEFYASSYGKKMGHDYALVGGTISNGSKSKILVTYFRERKTK